MGLVAQLIYDNVRRKRDEEERQRDRQRRQASLAAALNKAVAYADLQEQVGRMPANGEDVSLPPDQNGMTVTLPRPTFSAGDRLRRSAALAQAGINEKRLAETREQDLRNNALQDVLNQFRTGGNPDARYSDFINKKSIAPVKMAGGVAFNQYDTDSPIVGESSAVSALANYRAAQASDQEIRTEAIRNLLVDPTISPLLAGDLANKKDVYKPERVKVRSKDGGEVYYDATPNIAGGFDYSPAVDRMDNPVEAPLAGEVTDSTEAFNIRNRARILGISEQDALETLIHSKTKSPEDAWPDFVKLAAGSRHTRRGRDREKTQQFAANLFQLAFPNAEIPSTSSASDAEYATPEEVRAAFHAGEITRDEAESLLQGMGFE